MLSLKRPRLLCDEDCCEKPSLGEQVIVAFVQGAAPVVATVILAKLFPELREGYRAVEVEEDEDV